MQIIVYVHVYEREINFRDLHVACIRTNLDLSNSSHLLELLGVGAERSSYYS